MSRLCVRDSKCAPTDQNMEKLTKHPKSNSWQLQNCVCLKITTVSKAFNQSARSVLCHGFQFCAAWRCNSGSRIKVVQLLISIPGLFVIILRLVHSRLSIYDFGLAVYGACEKAFKVRQRCHFLGLAYNRLLCLDGQGKHQTRLKHAVGQLFVLL